MRGLFAGRVVGRFARGRFVGPPGRDFFGAETRGGLAEPRRAPGNDRAPSGRGGGGTGVRADLELARSRGGLAEPRRAPGNDRAPSGRRGGGTGVRTDLVLARSRGGLAEP